MFVRLRTETILKNIPTELRMSDMGIIESFCQIRKLRALVESKDIGFIEIKEIDTNKSVYSDKYRMWFDKDEYDIL